MPVMIIFHKLTFICAFRVFAHAALSTSDNKVESSLGGNVFKLCEAAGDAALKYQVTVS